MKEGGLLHPLWSPIFTAHMKRLEGVGEVSLCKLSHQQRPMVWNKSPRLVDGPAQFILGTEEGDVLVANLCPRKGLQVDSVTTTANTTVNKGGAVVAGADDEEEDLTSGREYVKWLAIH